MRHKRESQPVEYFYIMENRTGFMVSGVARKGSLGTRNSIVFCGSGRFAFARRFKSVESAKKYVEQFDIPGTSIIDAAGHVHFIYPERDESGVFCNA